MTKRHVYDSCQKQVQIPTGQPLSPEKLALHEAAHAIVTGHLGRRVIWVEIEPEAGRGQMVPETPWLSATRQSAADDLLIAMAGSAAQCKYEGKTPYQWTDEGIRDREVAESLAAEFDLDAHDFSKVSEILDRTEIWAKINALADLLINRRRIESCETEYF